MFPRKIRPLKIVRLLPFYEKFANKLVKRSRSRQSSFFANAMNNAQCACRLIADAPLRIKA